MKFRASLPPLLLNMKFPLSSPILSDVLHDVDVDDDDLMCVHLFYFFSATHESLKSLEQLMVMLRPEIMGQNHQADVSISYHHM